MADNRGVIGVAEKASLSQFFEELGIDNIMTGPAEGKYGLDWGHHYLADLDRVVQTYEELFLECSEFGPEHGNFGRICSPRFRCNGKLYVFNSVFFKEGEYKINTTICSADRPRENAACSIKELRVMLGMPEFPEIIIDATPRPTNLIDLLVWPFATCYRVRAKQIWNPALANSSQEPRAYAKVEIKELDTGKEVLRDVIPLAYFIGHEMLLTQLYALSQRPDYQHAEWQPLMEQCCRSVEGFVPPPNVYWAPEAGN
jgi:hypothetical protein